ncbi:hypothetical protein LCGC14_2682800, partial [marine sediment metagenome]
LQLERDLRRAVGRGLVYAVMARPGNVRAPHGPVEIKLEAAWVDLVPGIKGSAGSVVHPEKPVAHEHPVRLFRHCDRCDKTRRGVRGGVGDAVRAYALEGGLHRLSHPATELHAREFGADYGDAGHVWSGAPRDMTAAVLGEGGFMTRNGDTDTSDPLMAEVYSFPVAAAGQEGDVALSVEAEVSEANCGLEIEAQALELRGSDQVKTQNLTLAVPDCDAVGNFLVLNNLLQDLKVAQN